MKLERISTNQIRCTLTMSDLSQLEIRLSELAYGSDKARELFQQMLLRAKEELGFSVNNMPLMIEAVPVSEECLVLIITRVDDPEELDTRFSRFTPTPDEDSDEDYEEDSEENYVNVAQQLNKEIYQKKDRKETPAPITGDASEKEAEQIEEVRVTRIFTFDSLDSLTDMASQLTGRLAFTSTLYKSPLNNRYYLTITHIGKPEETFKRACALAAEYGNQEYASVNTLFYYEEHYKCLIAGKALEVLRDI